MSKIIFNPLTLWIPLCLAIHFCGALPGTALTIGLGVGWVTRLIWERA